MNTKSLFETAISDPRLRPDFDPSLLPTCDGHSGRDLAGSTVHERRMIEFMSIYYRMNAVVRRLQSLENVHGAEEEQRFMQDELCRLSQFRDQLEDRYAAEGFFGEPSMDGLYYADLLFVWAGKPPVVERVFQTTLSAEITF